MTSTPASAAATGNTTVAVSAGGSNRSVSFHSQISNTSVLPTPYLPPPILPIPNTDSDDFKTPNPFHHSRSPNNFRFHRDSDMAERIISDNNGASSSAMAIDGSDEDAVLSRSEFLTRQEVLRRRSRRLRQLARVYRDYYWALMEELQLKYRDYYWEYGKSPFQEDEDREIHDRAEGIAENGSKSMGSGLGVSNSSIRCVANGCKSKAMALTKFCHLHILSDRDQKLYIGCNYAIKSLPTGPVFCGKPILRSTVPPLCTPHFQKAEKHVARALKKAGLNVTSTSKLAPKLHVIVAEYVRQIQMKRRAALKANTENAEVNEDNSS